MNGTGQIDDPIMFTDHEVVLRVVASVRAYGGQDLLDNRGTILSTWRSGHPISQQLPACYTNLGPTYYRSPCDFHAFLGVRWSHTVSTIRGKV